MAGHFFTWRHFPPPAGAPVPPLPPRARDLRAILQFYTHKTQRKNSEKEKPQTNTVQYIQTNLNVRAIPQCCSLSVMYTRATTPNRLRWCTGQAALKGDPKSWEKPMATNTLCGGEKNFFLFKRCWSSTAHRHQVVRRTILLSRNSLVSVSNSLSRGSRQIALCIHSLCSRMCHFFWLRQVFVIARA